MRGGSFEGECVHLHLAEHGQETVAASGGEVITEAYALDEVEVGIENLLGSMVAEYADEQCHNALDDECIALGLEVNEALGRKVGGKPYATLAAFDEVLLSLGALGKWLLLRTEVNEELVFIHPIIEVVEFLDDIVLYLINGLHVF